MSDPNWKTLPALSALRALDATARHGGFSGAARSLNVTPAAVAQQVRSLEAELGVALAQRTGRSVSLTAAGERLTRSLAEGFEAIAGGVETLREIENRRGLRVATTPSIVDEFLLYRLRDFWRRHPGIEVSLMPQPRFVDLLGDGFDLAIRAGGGQWEGLDAEFLAPSRWVLAGVPELLEPIPQDLSKLPWILSRDEEWQLELVRLAGLDPDKLKVTDVGASALQDTMMREGFGVQIISEFLIRDDLAKGTVVAVELPGMTPLNYYAVTPRGPTRENVRLFIDWLKLAFADTKSAPAQT